MSYSSGNALSSAFSIRSSPQNTSTRIALWPLLRSALHTCVPETIEISRSVLIPPAKTTIFMLYYPLLFFCLS